MWEGKRSIERVRGKDREGRVAKEKERLRVRQYGRARERS